MCINEVLYTHTARRWCHAIRTQPFFFFVLCGQLDDDIWTHPQRKNDCIFLNMISFWYKRFFDGFLNYRQITAAWMADLKLYRPIYETISKAIGAQKRMPGAIAWRPTFLFGSLSLWMIVVCAHLAHQTITKINTQMPLIHTTYNCMHSYTGKDG